jgi:Phosphate-selective porin O and P
MRACTLLLVILLSALLSLLATRPSLAAEEYNFAGSAQLDYLLVPNGPHARSAPGSGTTFQGFTMEAGLKVAVDISEHLSANVKACYGCHGVEVDMAYFDFRPFDEFNLRVGRFSPTFGAFNLRHDPANHMLSDKPLPYDMGRMLRRGDWNNSVLPSPFPTNGVEVNGTHWFGTVAQFDYAVYGVTGFKNDSEPNPADLNFQESHLPYYVDTAIRPAAGGRLALTLKANPSVDITLGGSGIYGTYDLDHKLSYAIVGGDFTLRAHRTAFRVEYLARRQQFDTQNPDIFKYAIAASGGDFFTKQGAFAELEQPLSATLDFAARVDGMLRRGNISNVPVGSGSTAATTLSPLTDYSFVARETLGLAYALERNFRLKVSGELWQFSYPDEFGHKTALGFHFGAVGSF